MTRTTHHEGGEQYSSTIGRHVDTWCPYAQEGTISTELNDIAGNKCDYITNGICQLAAAGVRESFYPTDTAPSQQLDESA